jgi:hypothetical protein
MLEVFAGKVRKTGFFQKAGFPGIRTKILAFTIKEIVSDLAGVGPRSRLLDSARLTLQRP